MLTPAAREPTIDSAQTKRSQLGHVGTCGAIFSSYAWRAADFSALCSAIASWHHDSDAQSSGLKRQAPSPADGHSESQGVRSGPTWVARHSVSASACVGQ